MYICSLAILDLALKANVPHQAMMQNRFKYLKRLANMQVMEKRYTI